MPDPTGVYVHAGVEPEAYLAGIAADIRSHLHEPFLVSAVVMPPGFPGKAIGQHISGQCVAHREGYWLVYQQAEDTFYCFWGIDQSNLGAHGVFGGPLYCWSA